MRDVDIRFHREWLGLAQPIEGLVFSIPALADAQITPKVRAGITAELEAQLVEAESGIALRDVRGFFETFLGYSQPGMLVGREHLPAELSFYAPEGRQEIRPSFAIARGPFEDAADDPFAEFDGPAGTGDAKEEPDGGAPFVALVWDLSSDAGEAALGVELDKSETETGPWRYPPTAKLERLLRHTGIPIGFISNRRELRVVYAPTGEASAHLTFRFKDLAERAGRPLVAALELIFHATRTYQAAPEFTFEGLLRESRQRQADVTKDLAAQVFESVEILLEGFEHAAARDCVGDRPDWLRAAMEEPDDHLYQGILSVVLRLVFTLYAEDQSLVPVQHRTYAEHLSVFGLYERLADDAGAHPESMHLRFGSYGRLISLFRAMFLGVQHGELRLPPRRGKLFDPSAFPFLEGGLPGWTAAIALPEERAAVQLPSIDDDTVYRVLHRLVVFKGQRLSYRSLDVEQIGAVYESLMGYHVLRVLSPAVRLGKVRVWTESEALLAMKPADRKKFWKETCGLSTAAQKKAEAAVKDAQDAGALAEALAELGPGGKSQKKRHRVAAGRLVLQPGEERRRTGSHYTPRWLSEKVVRRTLEPILSCLGEDRTAEQILSLKICDPAMGSGAFLVAACRILAEEVVAAWERTGEAAALTEEHGDALLHARRLVAQRCLYGVDKNAAAVELAKLSLWLVTLSSQLPFTFVDHALRHGDSLLGLNLEQIRSFHWAPEEQIETSSRALADALEEALEHRNKILALAFREDVVSQREKQRLLEYAELATARVRMVADVSVGAFFANGTAKARENERNARLALVDSFLAGEESVRGPLETMADQIRRGHVPFHWMLEFPEVFSLGRPDPLTPGVPATVAFMDAFVGNPPFLFGKKISSSLGERYGAWLSQLHRTSKNADLCAHFFRRATDLLGAHGTLGLIATDKISQGETRAASLQVLVGDGLRLYSADRSLPWPGDASVSVSLVHLAKGRAAQSIDRACLDGQPVRHIDSYLEPRAERPDPARLESNAGQGFLGSFLYSEGFIMDPAQREALSESDRRVEERIKPYLGGDELNDAPDLGFKRYVIDLGDLDLAAAAEWPTLFAHLQAHVAPERAQKSAEVAAYPWWKFWRPRKELYETIAPMSRCLCLARDPSHFAFAFQPTERIFSDKIYVFALEAFTAFAVLQSRVHLAWASLHGRTTGGSATPSYSTTRCYQTFPFPAPDPRVVIGSLEAIGKELYGTRAAFMGNSNQGLTKTYNALKEPVKDALPIVGLRRLHEEMDRAVLDAYGWGDIGVPPFCLCTDEDRAALQAFEDETIDRLYVLNAERAKEEKRLGLGAKNKQARKGRAKKIDKAAGAKGAKASASKQEDLF